MADVDALYASLLAADEARDAAALAAVAWQVYGQLATAAADLGALRARFWVYAAAPHASGGRQEVRAVGVLMAAVSRRPRAGGSGWRSSWTVRSAWQGRRADLQ